MPVAENDDDLIYDVWEEGEDPDSEITLDDQPLPKDDKVEEKSTT